MGLRAEEQQERLRDGFWGHVRWVEIQGVDAFVFCTCIQTLTGRCKRWVGSRLGRRRRRRRLLVFAVPVFNKFFVRNWIVWLI